jgi:hypothetical protein
MRVPWVVAVRRVPIVSAVSVALASLILSVSAGCGGGGTAAPPSQDFTIAVAPSGVSAALGATTASITVSLTPGNGFAGAANLSLQGAPTGVTLQPAGSVTVSHGQPQAIDLAVASTASVGTYAFRVVGTHGGLAREASVTLTINPVVATSEDSTMIYLEARTATDTARIGLYKAWGAAITEASLNGVNYVNHDDPGRQVQTSLWGDSASSSQYNPVESGSASFIGSPVLATTLQPDALYIKTQPLQWWTGALGDAYIEKWISVVPGYGGTFKVHYRITHFGSDVHAAAPQELPVMYVNPVVPSFVYYSGNSPWSNAALTQFAMPAACCAPIVTTELWGAYVDATNTGIALYTPMQFPSAKGFNAGSTLQFTPLCPMSWQPGSVLEFDTYILLGAVAESRKVIYALHSQDTGASPLPPLGFGGPTPGSTLAGSAVVQGWAWAHTGMPTVEVFLDGVQVGTATYGLARPDVATVYAGAPDNVGFQYTLDTTRFANGSHSLSIKATDALGHYSTFGDTPIVIAN